jgi:hypothetical protein
MENVENLEKVEKVKKTKKKDLTISTNAEAVCATACEPQAAKVTEEEYAQAVQDFDACAAEAAAMVYKLSFHAENEAKDAGTATKTNKHYLNVLLKMIGESNFKLTESFMLVGAYDGLAKSTYNFKELCYELNTETLEVVWHFLLKFEGQSIETARNFVRVANAISKCVVIQQALNKKLQTLSGIINAYESQ